MLMSMKLEVLDLVKKLLKTMLVEMLRPDVGELVLRGDVIAVSYTHLTLPTICSV